MCPPILRVTESVSGDCAAINAFVIVHLRQHPPDQVLLAANWPSGDWPLVEQTISALRDMGVRNVVVVGRLPQWRHPLPDIMARATLRAHAPDPPVWVRNHLLLDQQRGDDDVRQFVLHHDADFVSPLRLLCDGNGACLGRDVSNLSPFTPLAFDTAHLTDVGFGPAGQVDARTSNRLRQEAVVTSAPRGGVPSIHSRPHRA